MKNQLPASVFCSRIFSMVLLMLFSFTAHAQLSEEDFELGIPSSWDVVHNDAASIDWDAVSGEGYQGSNAVKINPADDDIGAGNTGEYFLVSPQFTVPSNGIIRFYTKLGANQDNGTQYEIRLSTSSQPDIDGFNVTLATWNEDEIGSDYGLKAIELPPGISAGLNIYMAFVAVNPQESADPSGTAWFVDHVEVVEGCASVDPEDVNIDNITYDGATMTWDYPDSDNFVVAVVPEGDPVPTSGTDVNGHSHIFSGLEADTDYEAYIQVICANNTESIFVGPFPFITNLLGTSCDSPIEIPDVFSNGMFELQDNLANYENPDGETYDTQGSGCLDENTNYLNGDKIFFSYTASEDGLITIDQEATTGDYGNNCYNANTSVLIYNSCDDVGEDCLAATTTGFSDPYGSIQNFVVEAGQTYIIVMSSDLGPGAGICFDFTVDGSACAAPSGYFYDDLMQNSVKISWDNPGGFADEWEYVALPEGEDPPTGDGTNTSTNEDNEVTGLDAGTTYDFYVRSICSGTPGDWGDPFTFTTQCSVFSTPYEEDFDGANSDETAPDCWYTLDKNNDGFAWTYLLDGATLPFFNPSSYDDYLISPMIDMSGGQKRLRFDYEVLDADVPMEIVVSSEGIGPDNFTTVVSPEEIYETTGFDVSEEKIIILPEDLSGNLNFAWHIQSDEAINGTRINIKNVVIEDLPACSDPLDPQLEDVGQTSATFSWTPGFDEDQWDILIKDYNEEPTDEDTGILTGNNPYTAEDLEPGKRYEFYVRAHCNDDDQSNWVGPVSFNTNCPTYDTPFYESFNDEDSDTQKFCWETIDSNNDQFEFTIDEEQVSFMTPIFGAIQDFDDWLISPAIDIEGTKMLKFKYRANQSVFGDPRFGLQVLMSTTDTDPDSFEEIAPLFIFTNPDFEEKEVYFEANGPVYLAIRVPPEFTGMVSNAFIDDVEITEAPVCPDPTNLTVDSYSIDQAEFSWNAGFQETNWNVALVPGGSGEPTEPTDSSDETNYMATDLEPETVYDFYIQADCGDGDSSDWIGPVSFTTPCEAYDTPFHESFDSDSDTEGCWTINDANDDGEKWNTDITLFTYAGDQSAGMFTGTNGANNDWLITPGLNIQDNQRLRFYYRAGSQYYIEDLEVRISTTGYEPEDFTETLYTSLDEPDPIINNEEFKEKIINLPDDISGTVYIAFHVPQVQSMDITRGQSLFIDEVYIEQIPDCAQPSNLEEISLTDDSVKLKWDSNGDEDSWQIIVLPKGSDAPGEDIDEDADNVYVADSNPYMVENLEPSTSYDFYIRAICGEDSYSEWTGPTNVTTQCDFDNLCEYTFILHSTFGFGEEGLDITQNNQTVQFLPFNGDEDGEVFTVFLCTGIQYSLYFNTVGTVAEQYAQFWFEIKDFEGNTVYTSPDEGMQPKTTVYTGVSHCGEESCPMPTDLTSSQDMELSWTPGADEDQWEVAVQPVDNGSLPESGHLVDNPNYTPQAEDFVDPYAATYEFYVRAICSDNDQSYWAGPYVFVRNDSEDNAIDLPINEGSECAISETAVSFSNAHAASYSDDDEKDVWFEFEATSRVHIIEINGYEGNFYISDGTEPYPEIDMTLYQVNGDGSLDEMKSTNSNAIVTSYSSELTVGETYKVRLSLPNLEHNTRLFHICVTTPEDLCDLDAVNADFERPPLHYISALGSIITQWVVPGWRTDFIGSGKDEIYLWNDIIADSWSPYSGGQCVQLISDAPGDPSVGTPPGYEYDEDDPHGLYQDFDSSEITVFDYSFAYRARNPVDKTIQLFAGPPGGPYTLVAEKEASVGSWKLVEGSYNVPEGQDETRFMFTQKDYGLGMLVDDTHFKSNTDILTEPQTIACNENSIDVEANGVGTWIPDEDNPGEVSIEDAESNETTISGFSESGIYTFIWETRYCSHEISFDYEGVSEAPEVETPVEYCVDQEAEALTAPEAEGYTLVWFTDPDGEGSTEAPTPDTSAPGTTTYYVAYQNEDGCRGPLTEIVVNVSELVIPDVEFSYASACVISEENPMPELSQDFTEGGIFSSDDLDVDPVTGEIDLADASAGTYEVTYTVEENPSICLGGGTYTAEIELLPADEPVMFFDYPMEEYCALSEEIIEPVFDDDFTSGGLFSAPEGLDIDPETGAITIADSEPGSYEITYTVEEDPENCTSEGSYGVTIELTEPTMPKTAFEYPQYEYCIDSDNAYPNLDEGFSPEGEFTAEDGLDIDPETGGIDFANSSPGEYSITYAVEADDVLCESSAATTFTLLIYDDLDLNIAEDCIDNNLILTVNSNDYGNHDVTYKWSTESGQVIDQDAESINISVYLEQHQTENLPLSIIVVADYGDCSSSKMYTVNENRCGIIPEGISPNQDGVNDNFDLSHLHVRSIEIFNRYGVKVYYKNDGYTDQWFGQDKNGNELPDGTYYYVVRKQDGHKLMGWVYVVREH